MVELTTNIPSAMNPEVDPFEAGHRLWAMAQKDTNQGTHAARFLLGLYNGQSFPFDLTRLRSVDAQVLEDCLVVLQHSSYTNRWIEDILDVPFADFDALIKQRGWSPRLQKEALVEPDAEKLVPLTKSQHRALEVAEPNATGKVLGSLL